MSILRQWLVRVSMLLLGMVAVMSLHGAASAAFQYTGDSLIGIDVTPRNLWYVNGDRNQICVRSMGEGNIAMFIAKNSVKVVPNEKKIVALSGDVYEMNGQGYVKKTHVYMYGKDSAGMTAAYGGLAEKVAAAARQGVDSIRIDPYGSWQGKGTAARISEMFYYIATGQRFFGLVSQSQLPRTAAYRDAKAKQATVDYDVTLVYWFTQDVYDRCDGK